jgi:uncharacterized protein YqeY
MLLQTIDADLKTALKEKQETVLSALRNLKAALTNAKIEHQGELSDEEVLKVIAKKVKQHKDSIQSFLAGNRADLAQTEQAQLAVLEQYLPAGLSDAEVSAIVAQTIDRLRPAGLDFGKVMKEAMKEIAGRADGQLVSQLVKEQLK